MKYVVYLTLFPHFKVLVLTAISNLPCLSILSRSIKNTTQLTLCIRNVVQDMNNWRWKSSFWLVSASSTDYHISIPLYSSKSSQLFLVSMIHSIIVQMPHNSFPPGQNGRHFADAAFRDIFLNENICILIKISLKFVPECPIDNNPALV